MEHFDVLVIGTGSGMLIASAAVEQGLHVAIVDNGPMGGTCINRGCVPSKMLIYPAAVATAIQSASKIGINATVQSVDFQNIMTRMHTLVTEDTGAQARAVEATPTLKWYKGTAEFTDSYTLQVGQETISAKMIFIVSGARFKLPPIKGIETVDYLTSDSVLELQSPPKSIIVLGGGYIGVEYGHFFSGIGIKTTILQKPDRLLTEEEPEIGNLLKLELQKRMDIFTGYEAVEVRQEGNQKIVTTKNVADGSIREFTADALMVAAGRAPNSDLLKPEKTGVKLDSRGFIKVNEYLETDKKNIWALGDAIGKYMFKHVANYEAGLAWHNANHSHKVKADFSAAPHAVFCEPQIASVGLKEAEAKQAGYHTLVGLAFYKDTAMGAAMGSPAGFVKAIVDGATGKILGTHIIGPEAANLIQEVITAMNTSDRSYALILQSMHIHPAMSEVVQNAFGNLQHAE
jgi:dihydrolipoamide dehydrogenase